MEYWTKDTLFIQIGVCFNTATDIAVIDKTEAMVAIMIRPAIFIVFWGELLHNKKVENKHNRAVVNRFSYN